jgi:RNA polymerase sigma-70 factor (ECF subfamily)
MNPTHYQWSERLASDGPNRDRALGDLRAYLFKAVRTGLSGRSRVDDSFVEDVVQIALVRILDNLHTFEGRSAFTTWALAIALRVAFTELRRSHWNNVSLDELRERDSPFYDRVDTSSDLHESVVRNDLVAAVHHLIRTRLTSRQQDILLAQLNEMPQEEIARQMNISRNAAYKLGHDARKALRRALEKEGFRADDVHDAIAGEAG